MVDGKMSTRADRFGGHGFGSLEAALSWLDEETSFITAALRHSRGVDQRTVLDLLGALCDYCLLRGDLYRLGEIDELAASVGQGPLSRSVRWRTGIAARQIGELDKAHTTLASVVSSYREDHQDPGAALALCSLGITLHHQGKLAEAADRLREALALQEPEALAADRGWTLHALAAVERDRGGSRRRWRCSTAPSRCTGRTSPRTARRGRTSSTDRCCCCAVTCRAPGPSCGPPSTGTGGSTTGAARPGR